MISKFMGIVEIGAAFYFIFSVATHTATTGDYLIFLMVTLLFCMTIARGASERRRVHGELSKAKARANYDRRRYDRMRKELEEMDEEEYATHPINAQEFAAKIIRGEASLDEIPNSRSRAEMEYAEAHPEEIENRKKENRDIVGGEER